MVRYRKTGPARFISHLDTERFWRRAVRRAGLPAARTSGFSVREKIELGYPLPVGCESEGEDFVLELEAELEPGTVAERLAAVIPDGFGVAGVFPYQAKESLFIRTRALVYQVEGKRVELPVENGRSPRLWPFLSEHFGCSEAEAKLFRVIRTEVRYRE